MLPTFAICQTASHASQGNLVSHCTLVFGLCVSFITTVASCVSCQYSQPVRVAQPWHNRTVLLRRLLLLRLCTPTLWWDQYQRRIQKMKPKGSPTCSWRKRRIGPCHHPLVAQTAPMKWDLTTLTAQFTISGWNQNHTYLRHLYFVNVFYSFTLHNVSTLCVDTVF